MKCECGSMSWRVKHTRRFIFGTKRELICKNCKYEAISYEVLFDFEKQRLREREKREKQGKKDHSKYKIWRKHVFARDDYRCQLCGSEKMIEADHIKSFLAYPERRYWITNGRTLCKSCHTNTPNYGMKARKELKNRLALLVEFKELSR